MKKASRVTIGIVKDAWGDEGWDWFLWEGKEVIALNEVSFKTKQKAIEGFLRAKRLMAEAEIEEGRSERHRLY